VRLREREIDLAWDKGSVGKSIDADEALARAVFEIHARDAVVTHEEPSKNRSLHFLYGEPEPFTGSIVLTSIANVSVIAEAEEQLTPETAGHIDSDSQKVPGTGIPVTPGWHIAKPPPQRGKEIIAAAP
jgi:hypothetical protein